VLNFLLVLIVTNAVSQPQLPGIYTSCFPHLSTAGRRDSRSMWVALRGWLVGILFNMSVIATLSGIGLALLGIPLLTGTGGFGRNTRLFLTLAQL